MSSLYPVFLKLDARPVLIAGGGEIALGKARSLLPCGARLTVVAPRLHEELRDMAAREQLAVHERAFAETDLDGQALVFAATDDADLNREIVRAAGRKGILANAVDDMEHGDFYSAAVVRRGPFVVAVGTEGRFPGLTRALREAFERWLPLEWAEAGDALAGLRAAIRATPLLGARKIHAIGELRAWFTREYLSPQESIPS